MTLPPRTAPVRQSAIKPPRAPEYSDAGAPPASEQEWPEGPPPPPTDPAHMSPIQKLHLAARIKKNRPKKKPNILIITADDVGRDNISAYNLGIQGFFTSNIDSIGRDGAIFTHSYGQNSCTAGRSAIMLGQCPFRTGLTSVGMPGSPNGIPDWTPTLADLLKEQGYTTAQIGKNHMGDWNKHLPTVHGFDYFYGNLYHLNTSEEPFQSEYPKEPEFFAKYGPRNVLECQATDRPPPDVREDPRFGAQGNQIIRDDGPLPPERMRDFDEKELLPRMLKFIEDQTKRREQKDDEPWFLWACPSRMHVWTHLQEGSEGQTPAGLFGDGLVEHDRFVGALLDKLDQLGIAEDTIVVWTTDNGAEKASWPDGGSTAFHGEKGTTNEGAFRVPLLIRWPGVIEPGTLDNTIFSFEDFIPTFLSAAGNDNVVEELKAGGKKRFGREDKEAWGKIHLDGYNFLPYWCGEADLPPRETFIYFGQSGKLDAVRWRDYKAAFASNEGDIFQGTRVLTNAPILTNLREDPFQVMSIEGQQYMHWYGERLWVFAPCGDVVNEFVASLHGYENAFKTATSMGADDINYDTMALADIVDKLKNHRIRFRDPFQ
jgi:arylsulfatase A-like enzyme